MQHDASATRLGRDCALAALRAKLDKARQGEARATAGRAADIDTLEMRQVYASHIAWLEDRICEMETSKGEE
ncbi:MAG: hypothetical protein KJZ80_00355 [Hyphomicrobiaceae bacterium]|nr:hypothetical protein [Hyphomicrobiaceae bacterium]